MHGTVICATGPAMSERDAAAIRRVASGFAEALGATLEPCEPPRGRSHGALADRMLTAARQHDARLLVVPGGAFGPFGTAVLGSLTHTLARRSPCPVVVVPRAALARVTARPAPWEAGERTLVCGIDRSPESLKVARTAATLAAGFGDELVLLHTLRDEAGMGTDAPEPAQAHVERTVLSVGGYGYVQAVQPVLGLCSLAAQSEARMLVVGARRLGRMSLLLGRSVSTRLAAVADRPVVVVPQRLADSAGPTVVP